MGRGKSSGYRAVVGVEWARGDGTRWDGIGSLGTSIVLSF